MAQILGHALVILACDHAGGYFRPENQSCKPAANGTLLGEDPTCLGLDALVTQQDTLTAWGVTVAVMLVLGIPTVVLRSRWRENGIQFVTGQHARLLLLMVFVIGRTSVENYVFGLHACVSVLVGMKPPGSSCVLGSPLWWRLRYIGVLLILIHAAMLGPPVSVTHWPAVPEAFMRCAHRTHLRGAVIPDLALFVLAQALETWRYVLTGADL